MKRQRAGLGLGFGLTALVLVAVSACRDDSAPGAAGDGGAGGAPPQEVDVCGPYSLAGLCSADPKQCPSSPEDIVAKKLCSFSLVIAKQYDTTCGGHVVNANFGTHDIVWGFDANGKLSYEYYANDVDSTCTDGKTTSSTWTWGETRCKPVGEPVPFSCTGATDSGGGAGGMGGAEMSGAGGIEAAGEGGAGGQAGATP